MFRNSLICLFVLTLLSVANCESRPEKIWDIAGKWRSDSGATIVIPEYEQWTPPGGFSFKVHLAGGSHATYKALWRTGFRQGFVYKTGDGDTIYAVVDIEGQKIGLGNEDSSWKAEWKRLSR